MMDYVNDLLRSVVFACATALSQMDAALPDPIVAAPIRIARGELVGWLREAVKLRPQQSSQTLGASSAAPKHSGTKRLQPGHM